MAEAKKTTKKTTAKKTNPKKTATKKAPAKKTATKSTPAKAASKPAPKAKPAVTSVAEKESLSIVPRVLPRLPATLPVRNFILWAALIIAVFSGINMWLADVFVQARQADIVAEVKERNAIQASGRAAVLREWIDGRLSIADSLVQNDLMRLFAAEMGSQGLSNNPESQTLRSALVAQIPYMQQVLKELVQSQSLASAHLVNAQGEAFLASPQGLKLTQLQRQYVQKVFQTKQPEILAMRLVNGELVVDVLKPVFVLDDEDKNPAVTSVFLMTSPVGAKLAQLLDLGPLTKDGESAYLLQRVGSSNVVLVEDSNLSMLETNLEDLQEKVANPDKALPSVVNEYKSFSSLVPLAGTPFAVLQEFAAKKALAPMEEYRNGVYGIVSLAAIALIAVALLVVAYLLAQRNRVRVQHQSKTMEALVKAVEIRDPYLSGHYARVARLSVALGNTLGLPVRQRSTLFYAAMLSGVGKIFVPQAVLTKKGKLTKGEREDLEKHVNYAMDVLRDVNFELPIADVIQQMSERMDGSGYPNSLKGEEVNILSRILAVCDTYCALTRPRSYREAMSEEEAVTYLKESLNQYDEKVVKQLIAHLQSPV